jgi:hypothetical protein
VTAKRRRTREDYERGLPDYHDPTAGFGGAAPTYSALTFRAVLAAFGLLASIAGVVVFLVVIWLRRPITPPDRRRPGCRHRRAR